MGCHIREAHALGEVIEPQRAWAVSCGRSRSMVRPGTCNARQADAISVWPSVSGKPSAKAAARTLDATRSRPLACSHMTQTIGRDGSTVFQRQSPSRAALASKRATLASPEDSRGAVTPLRDSPTTLPRCPRDCRLAGIPGGSAPPFPLGFACSLRNSSMSRFIFSLKRGGGGILPEIPATVQPF